MLVKTRAEDYAVFMVHKIHKYLLRIQGVFAQCYSIFIIGGSATLIVGAACLLALSQTAWGVSIALILLASATLSHYLHYCRFSSLLGGLTLLTTLISLVTQLVTADYSSLITFASSQDVSNSPLANLASLTVLGAGSISFLINERISPLKSLPLTRGFLACWPLIYGATGLYALILDLPPQYGFTHFFSIQYGDNLLMSLCGLILLIEHTPWQEYQEERVPAWVPPYFGLIMILVSLLGYMILEKKDYNFLKQTTQHTTQQLATEITRSLNAQRNALQRMADRWSEQKTIPKSAWLADANNLLKDFPNFQALEWMDQDYTIRWVVPLESNQKVVNFRVPPSNPAIFHLRRAFTQQSSVTTQVIPLVQGGEGFINYTPIFDQKNNFYGFIVGVFRVKSVIDSLLSNQSDYEGFAFKVIESGRIIYQTNYLEGYDQNAAIKISTNINEHSPWTIYGYPSFAISQKSHSLLPLTAFIAAICLSGFFTLCLSTLRRVYIESEKAQKANDKLTYEIEERQRIEEQFQEQTLQLDLFTNLVNLSRDALIIVDYNTRELMYYNNSTFTSLGYSEHEFMLALQHGNLVAKKMERIIQKAASSRRKLTSSIYQMEVIKKDGSALQVEVTTRAAILNHRKYLLVVVHDVTEHRELEKRLITLSTRDMLTGVYNRKHFESMLINEWERAARQAEPLALMIIDIDNFRFYNEAHGHQQGDICLKDVANILKRSITRSVDVLSRFEGQQFVALLPETDQCGAEEIARRIHNNLHDAHIHHPLSSIASFVTVSIGLSAGIPEPGSCSQDLVKFAQKALALAKKSGCNQTVSNEHVQPNLREIKGKKQ